MQKPTHLSYFVEKQEVYAQGWTGQR